MEDFQTVNATLRENIITSLENTNSADLDMTLKTIEHNQEMIFELIRDKRAGQLTETEYNSKGSEIEQIINELTAKKEMLEQKCHSAQMTNKRIDEIIKIIDKIDVTQQFDEELFKNIVDIIIVRGNTLEFKLKVGITERITIQK